MKLCHCEERPRILNIVSDEAIFFKRLLRFAFGFARNDT